MTNTEFRKELREICTTHKEQGGGYFNLSEEQFEKIMQLFAEHKAELINETIKRMQKIDAQSWEWDRGGSEIPGIISDLTKNSKGENK